MIAGRTLERCYHVAEAMLHCTWGCPCLEFGGSFFSENGEEITGDVFGDYKGVGPAV